MFPFRRLVAWRRAHALVLHVHEVVERVSRGRYLSLIDQMCRCSMSIAANIAEGSGQVSGMQFARYLTIALGSARELDYHVLLARDLGVFSSSDYARLDARVDEVCRVLVVLRRRVVERASARTRTIRSGQAGAVNLPSPLSHLSPGPPPTSR